MLTERCYGCGRCLGACPLGLIEEHQQVLGAEQWAPLLLRLAPDALELHTSRGRGRLLRAAWHSSRPLIYP